MPEGTGIRAEESMSKSAQKAVKIGSDGELQPLDDLLNDESEGAAQTAAARYCTDCGTPNVSNAQYCASCGHALALQAFVPALDDDAKFQGKRKRSLVAQNAREREPMTLWGMLIDAGTMVAVAGICIAAVLTHQDWVVAVAALVAWGIIESQRSSKIRNANLWEMITSNGIALLVTAIVIAAVVTASSWIVAIGALMAWAIVETNRYE